MRILRNATACLAAGIFLLDGLWGGNAKMIKVSVSEQKLYLVEKGRIEKAYPVSTSKYGIGSEWGSNKTPLGKHKVAAKIGDGAPWGTIFKERRDTGKSIKDPGAIGPNDKDLVTTRILRLEGLEEGVNKGKGIDSFERCIYLHGTPDEDLVGKPASHGCIRMKNDDVIELYSLVDVGTPVVIEK